MKTEFPKTEIVHIKAKVVYRVFLDTPVMVPEGCKMDEIVAAIEQLADDEIADNLSYRPKIEHLEINGVEWGAENLVKIS